MSGIALLHADDGYFRRGHLYSSRLSRYGCNLFARWHATNVHGSRVGS